MTSGRLNEHLCDMRRWQCTMIGQYLIQLLQVLGQNSNLCFYRGICLQLLLFLGMGRGIFHRQQISCHFFSFKMESTLLRISPVDRRMLLLIAIVPMCMRIQVLYLRLYLIKRQNLMKKIFTQLIYLFNEELG